MPSHSNRIAVNSITSSSTTDLSTPLRSTSISQLEETEKSASSPSPSPGGLRWKFEDTADRVKYLRTKQIHHLFEELCTALLEVKPEGSQIYDFLIDYMERNEEEAQEQQRGTTLSLGSPSQRDTDHGATPQDCLLVSTQLDVPASDETPSPPYRPAVLTRLDHRRPSGDEGSDPNATSLSETHPKTAARRRSSHYSTGGEEEEIPSPRRSHDGERPWWARGRVEAKEARLKAASRTHRAGNASVGPQGSCTPLGSALPQTGGVEPQTMSARRGNRAARGVASGPRGKIASQKPQTRLATKPLTGNPDKPEASATAAFVTSTDGGEGPPSQESVVPVIVSHCEGLDDSPESSDVFSYFAQTLPIIHADWLLDMP